MDGEEGNPRQARTLAEYWKDPFSKSGRVTRTPDKKRKKDQEERIEQEEIDGRRQSRGQTPGEREISELLFEELKRSNELKGEIMKELRDLKIENRGIRTEIEKMREEHELWRNEMQTWKAEKREEQKELSDFKEEIRKRLDYQERTIERLEKDKRKRNLIVKGIEEGKDETSEVTKAKCEQLFKENLEVEGLRKLFKIGKELAGRNRVILAEIETEEGREEILSNAKKLRGSNIYIERDMSENIRRIQYEIRKQAVEARKEGEKVKIGEGKQLIEGEELRWYEEEQKLKE